MREFMYYLGEIYEGLLADCDAEWKILEILLVFVNKAPYTMLKPIPESRLSVTGHTALKSVALMQGTKCIFLSSQRTKRGKWNAFPSQIKVLYYTTTNVSCPYQL